MDVSSDVCMVINKYIYVDPYSCACRLSDERDLWTAAVAKKSEALNDVSLEVRHHIYIYSCVRAWVCILVFSLIFCSLQGTS